MIPWRHSTLPKSRCSLCGDQQLMVSAVYYSIHSIATILQVQVVVAYIFLHMDGSIESIYQIV